MKKSNKKYFILIAIITLCLLCMFGFCNYSYAGVRDMFMNQAGQMLQNEIDYLINGSADGPIQDPNSFKPGAINDEDANIINGKANSIIGVLITVGVIVSCITLGILGIKYMIGSVEEKAEYKKSMIPYIIGAVLLLASSTIVSIIANLVQNSNLGT